MTKEELLMIVADRESAKESLDDLIYEIKEKEGRAINDKGLDAQLAYFKARSVSPNYLADNVLDEKCREGEDLNFQEYDAQIHYLLGSGLTVDEIKEKLCL